MQKMNWFVFCTTELQKSVFPNEGKRRLTEELSLVKFVINGKKRTVF